MVVLLLNVIMPGVGTIFAALNSPELMTETILVGIFQFLTAFIVIGYVWSIAWSIELIKRNKEAEIVHEDRGDSQLEV